MLFIIQNASEDIFLSKLKSENKQASLSESLKYSHLTLRKGEKELKLLPFYKGSIVNKQIKIIKLKAKKT